MKSENGYVIDSNTETTGISPLTSQKNESDANHKVQIAIMAPTNPELLCYSSAQRVDSNSSQEEAKIIPAPTMN